MEPAIPEGSLLIIDKKGEIRDGKIVLAEIDGNYCMKRFVRKHGRVELHSENPNYPPIVVTEGMNCHIFGRVTHVINFV